MIQMIVEIESPVLEGLLTLSGEDIFEQIGEVVTEAIESSPQADALGEGSVKINDFFCRLK